MPSRAANVNNVCDGVVDQFRRSHGVGTPGPGPGPGPGLNSISYDDDSLPGSEHSG